MNQTVVSFSPAGAWTIVKAALILVFAFLIAGIVKSLAVKLFTRTKLSALLGKAANAEADSRERVIEFIGKLAYFLVFLLFVPGIFEVLGMEDVSAPILNLLNILWGYLPNILAAAIVLWIGFFLAKLARELLVPVFNRLKIDRLQEKAELPDAAKLSNTLAYIVYVLILIPVVIAALQVLDIQAISDPAVNMLTVIFAFLPNILAALILIVIGCMIARFVGSIVENLIAATGLDAKLSRLLEKDAGGFVLSRVVGTTAHVVIVIFFVVESFRVLHLQVVTNIGNAVIGYLPYALAAVLILIACYICGGAIQKALNDSGHRTGALLGKYALYVIGVLMALNELGVAEELVNAAFILAVAAIAAAFALSFGIGGRAFAARVLKTWEEKCGQNHTADTREKDETASPVQ